MQKNMEEICLKHDNGSDLQFRGRLFSECSWYDEEHGMLTRQKLYVTEGLDEKFTLSGTFSQMERHVIRR